MDIGVENGTRTTKQRRIVAMRRHTRLIVALATAVLGGAFLPAVRGADPADWPMYNHDLAGWRFNPAEKRLSPANAGKLVETWRFPAAAAKEIIGVVHATPTVVAGEVYFG